MALIEEKGGSKVGWETYDNLLEAEARGVTARREAVQMEQRGYDFGYCTPGTVEQVRKYHDSHDITKGYYLINEWVVTVP